MTERRIDLPELVPADMWSHFVTTWVPRVDPLDKGLR
jgi:hypothetical protein